MKRILILFMFVLLTFALAACGAKEGTVTQEQLDKLEEGMTKSDVEETLGEPLAKEENQWTYDLKKDDEIIELTVFFLINGDELIGSTTSSKN